MIFIEEVKTPGGVYTPRISVSLEHSDIQFAEFGAKARMGVFENEVQAQLEHVTSDIIIRSLIEIRSALSSEATTCAQKLHELSPRLAAISRSKQATPQLIDALLGMVKVSLRLESSQNIRAQAYRQILTKEPTASHKPIKGTTDFLNVRPEFGLIGESDAKSLALFVLYDDASVQIPVQYITQIQKAE